MRSSARTFVADLVLFTADPPVPIFKGGMFSGNVVGSWRPLEPTNSGVAVLRDYFVSRNYEL